MRAYLISIAGLLSAVFLAIAALHSATPSRANEAPVPYASGIGFGNLLGVERGYVDVSLPHISGHLDCWLRPAVKGVPDGHHEVSARVPAAGG